MHSFPLKRVSSGKDLPSALRDISWYRHSMRTGRIVTHGNYSVFRTSRFAEDADAIYPLVPIGTLLHVSKYTSASLAFDPLQTKLPRQ